jgi:drug/metabolite transporter (DMT)-like permease
MSRGHIVSLIIPLFGLNQHLNQWSLMAGIGVFACIGHLFLILSLKYADASKLAPLGYTEIIPNVL